MSVHFEKDFILRIFCLARQAERSVDFALHTPWESFQQYYTDDRIRPLEKVLELLPPMTRRARPIRREDIGGLTILRALSLPFKAVLNRMRRSWRFRPIEVQFFAQVLIQVIDTIHLPEKPDWRTLVELRMDLRRCEWLIEYKLFGLSILRKAAQIEHFCQSDYLPHVQMDEICGRDDREPSTTRDGDKHEEATPR